MVDNPTITTQRDSIPDWAKADQASAPDPDAWTDRQKAFVLSLISERDTSGQTQQVQDWLQSLADEKRYLTKRAASELIEKLLKFPKKTVKHDGEDGFSPNMVTRFEVGVPAGRYAVENEQGELRFYNVWISRDKKRLNVYVAHGPDESDLVHQKTVLSVLNKIKDAGIRECAIRYGMEIGHCSNCGRRLTNRISRVLGIGPVCGGRMFGDDFKADVKAARTELKRLGLNPDEDWTE